MPSSHLIPRFPLLLLPSLFPSIRVFSNESAVRSGSQSIGTSASASVLPMNIQDWFPLGLTGLMSFINVWTVNFQMFKLDLEKAEEPEIKLPTFIGSSKKQESSGKTALLTTYAKAFDCVGHNRLWKILKEMGIPDHLTCLLRDLYAGQEATIRTVHATTDWFHTPLSVSRLYIITLLI